jgi:hypothetical protein
VSQEQDRLSKLKLMFAKKLDLYESLKGHKTEATPLCICAK